MGPRRVVGITGAPGAGKTTYALGLVAASGVPAAYVPMDGFHLADVTLEALGRLDRKGAPDTFDAWGYAALLRRLREERDHVVYAPGFERDLEQPIAGALAVPPEAELVVTEGNYLLLDRPEWRAVRAELDEVVHLETDDEVRRRRGWSRGTWSSARRRPRPRRGWPGSTRRTPPSSRPPRTARTASSRAAEPTACDRAPARIPKRTSPDPVDFRRSTAPDDVVSPRNGAGSASFFSLAEPPFRAGGLERPGLSAVAGRWHRGLCGRPRRGGTVHGPTPGGAAISPLDGVSRAPGSRAGPGA